MSNSKLIYLDGLRGIASLIVVFHHLILTYFWGMYSGSINQIKFPFEYLYASTPLNLFYAGNFAVCIFFILSGYVLAHKFFIEYDLSKLASSVFRRYFRLAIPVILTVFIIYIIERLGLFHNDSMSDFVGSGNWIRDAVYNSADIKELFKEITSQSIFLSESRKYLNVLWTLSYEFKGSMLVFLIVFLRKYVKIKKFFYIGLILLTFQTYYLGFVLGVCFLELEFSKQLEKYKPNYVVQVLLLCIVIYFGSVASKEFPLYAWWYNLTESLIVDPWVFAHYIAATALMYLVIVNNVMQKVLSLKPMRFLGRISFGLYLIHLVVISSFSLWFTSYLNDQGIGYINGFIINALISIVLMFILSYWFSLFDEKLQYRVKWITDKIIMK